MVRPLNRPGLLPVIVWCRGGIGTEGALTLGDALIMSNWARRGYVVLASNYRGGPRSEGRDESGGADVHDVEALLPLARSLPFADAGQLFLYGYSRGGMMVYEALADGLPARAAVVNSGVSDLTVLERPDAREMRALQRAAMPDYAREAAHGFPRRSAIRWPEKLKRTPLLILRGTADKRVAPRQALAMAQALQRVGAPCSLHLVAGGSHVRLDQDQGRIDAEILDFFDAHRAPAPRP